MNNNEFFEALDLIEREKGIPADYIADKISEAIVVAVKKDYAGRDIVFCNIDCTNRTFRVFVRKDVVEDIETPACEMLIEDARRIDPLAEVGGTVENGCMFTEVESSKTASEVIAPVTGEIIAVNEELDDTPEAINDDAYDAWIIEVRLDDNTELDALLSAEEYEACCTEE